MLLELLHEGIHTPPSGHEHGEPASSVPQAFTSLQEEMMGFRDILSCSLPLHNQSASSSASLPHGIADDAPQFLYNNSAKKFSQSSHLHRHFGYAEEGTLGEAAMARRMFEQVDKRKLGFCNDSSTGRHHGWQVQPAEFRSEAQQSSSSSATSEPVSTVENCTEGAETAQPGQAAGEDMDPQAQYNCAHGAVLQGNRTRRRLGEGKSAMQQQVSLAKSIKQEVMKNPGTLVELGEPPLTQAAASGHTDAENMRPPRPALKKRKRGRICKNREEVENQRMTHIAVERNRRKQMNEHLGVLRSLMPPSYIQRGDQASVIGGAIEFVKELEHVLQMLQAQKLSRDSKNDIHVYNHMSEDQGHEIQNMENLKEESYFHASQNDINFANSTCDRVNVQVRRIGSCALVKVLTNKSPHQLLSTLTSIENLCWKIMHLNITTIEGSSLYSFNIEVQGQSNIQSASGIAQLFQDIFRVCT